VASQHPVDSVGLVLPEASWPDEPGSAGVLEPLRRLCNTTNRENGADAWRTPGELAGWLRREGYVVAAAIDDAALARLVAVREALWHAVGTADLAPFARTVGVVAMRIDASERGVALAPAWSDVDAVVGRLALAVAEASITGALGRLKSCRHCRWVFHDTSKNRSGRWCSMAACGGRDKARSYRRRRSDGGGDSSRPEVRA
jgi:predicted RNA-binding Zn ribbon-like protein